MMSNSSILELADHPAGWGPGDRVVVASTDYSMHQAEEFTLLPCPHCNSRQVKIQGERERETAIGFFSCVSICPEGLFLGVWELLSQTVQIGTDVEKHFIFTKPV